MEKRSVDVEVKNVPIDVEVVRGPEDVEEGSGSVDVEVGYGFEEEAAGSGPEDGEVVTNPKDVVPRSDPEDVDVENVPVYVEVGSGPVDVEVGNVPVAVEVGSSFEEEVAWSSPEDVEVVSGFEGVGLGKDPVDVEAGNCPVDAEVGSGPEDVELEKAFFDVDAEGNAVDEEWIPVEVTRWGYPVDVVKEGDVAVDGDPTEFKVEVIPADILVDDPEEGKLEEGVDSKLLHENLLLLTVDGATVLIFNELCRDEGLTEGCVWAKDGTDADV